MAGSFDKLDKVNIIFPIPGQAEVIVHAAIVQDEMEKLWVVSYITFILKIGLGVEIRLQCADVSAPYTSPVQGKDLEMNTDTVQIDKVVSMEYTLHVDNEEIDSSKGQDPLQFLVGHGNIISGLERELMGMKVGESKDVVIQPADAYGEFDEQAYMDVPRKDFPTDMQIEKGTELTVRDDSGQSRYARIDMIDGDTVRLNFNHPLAGDELHFNVRVVGLREPTSEELEHGHVHEDGHQH
jgi:FKBP-type peptidyl-prolyl cis-trans isomerase SlyD